MRKRIHLTESQLYGLAKKALNETLYSQPSEGDNTDKQQLVNFIIQTMRDIFLTSVWDVEGYVELHEDGESEPRDTVQHIQVINGSKLMLYDNYVGNKWSPDEVDLFTLQKLAAYMNKEKQKAKSNGIVGDIEVSERDGMILPYRFIGDTMIRPIACKDYTNAAQIVSADDFYYNDYDDYDERYRRTMRGGQKDESLARRVTESVIRLIREQFNADEHTVIFDRPEEALRFIQRHGRGKETLSINTDKLYFGGGQVVVPNDYGVDFMMDMLDWGLDYDKGMERGQTTRLLTKDTILAYLKWLNEKEKGLYFTTNYDRNGNQKPLGRFMTTRKDVYGF